MLRVNELVELLLGINPPTWVLLAEVSVPAFEKRPPAILEECWTSLGFVKVFDLEGQTCIVNPPLCCGGSSIVDTVDGVKWLPPIEKLGERWE